MGFGPKLFQFHKKETQYTLRLIPLGGYCMMLSEDDEENENDENSFEKKSKNGGCTCRTCHELCDRIFIFHGDHSFLWK